MFILRWQEPKKKKKARSPLGNLPDTEYEAMGEFVERHLPDLFKLAPPADDIPKEPSRGIPTPKKIRESLEKMFSSKSLPKWVTEREKVLFPEEVGEIKEEVDPFGKAYIEGIEGVDGGGSGGHSKTRSKVVKPPVPSAAFEALKDTIIQKFDKPADYIVLSTLAFYVKKIRDTIKATKEEEYIDVGDVVDGLVSLLKRLYYFITHLVVEPSTKEWKLPPEGAPKSSGRPDIVINNMADVKKVYDKILEIYKIINHYIKPDTVGIPSVGYIHPDSLQSKSQQMKRYLPIGLIDWYPVFQREEEKKKDVKKAHIPSMAYKIAIRFAKQRITELDIAL
jgi:hypothetical protein